jgi:molybdopterin/thiamine biosynthesis adenylyltransferase
MYRPRVKPEHAPYRISGNRIRLGGVSYGIAAEVKDPEGWVWTLLDSMDGSRSVTDIVERVVTQHPGKPEDAVRIGVDRFVAAGYVEDAGAPVPAELTERDKQRYDRALGYFRWMDRTPRASSWEPQAALRRARVTVVGLGGTGGIAAMALAASGVGQLTCVDHDTVELSNLNRQVLYTEEDIGRPKVDAAVERLRALNSDIDIRGVARRIDGVDDLVPLAQDRDVLLLAADRPAELRQWTNRASLATGTPWVDAGYHGPLVSVGTFVPGRGCCWECLRATQDDQDEALGISTDRAPAVANAVGAPSAGISAYLAVHFVLALVTGVPSVPVGRVHAINLVVLDAPFVIHQAPRRDCPACGGAE